MKSYFYLLLLAIMKLSYAYLTKCFLLLTNVRMIVTKIIMKEY